MDLAGGGAGAAGGAGRDFLFYDFLFRDFRIREQQEEEEEQRWEAAATRHPGREGRGGWAWLKGQSINSRWWHHRGLVIDSYR